MSKPLVLLLFFFGLQLLPQEIYALPPNEVWWNLWPRFSISDSVEKLKKINSDTVTASAGLNDEGRGPLFRAIDNRDNKTKNSDLKSKGYKTLGWIEGQGQTRLIIAALHQNKDGSFAMDPGTGAASILAHNWSWDAAGPEVNPLANFIAWFGMASYVNAESWLGPYSIRNESFKMPIPIYPDGRPALGYKENSPDPRSARIYDALGAKDINGQLNVDPEPAGEKSKGKILVTLPNGKQVPVGDFSIGKDQSSPWWMQYNLNAAKYLISQGADGFWQDNASGWDTISGAPLRVAFGDWTIHEFRNFLKSHGQNFPNDFDVRQYLKEKLQTWTGISKEKISDLSFSGWGDRRFLDDPVWKAFLSYKSMISGQRARELYQGIKTAASGLNKNPEKIYVGGNDVPAISFGGFKGQEIDQVNTETAAGWGLDTGPVGRGLPPLGHGGSFYETAVSFGQSQHAVVWFYLEGEFESYRRHAGIGQVLGFEALAHGSFLNFNPDSEKSAGTLESTLFVNNTIERLAPEFGLREPIANIAILYSTQTAHSWLTPSGFYGFDKKESQPADPGYLDHQLGFHGWGAALDDLHLPYRSIPDFKLSLKSLETVSILILPHVRVLDPKAINETLIPFLNQGGTLIISGKDSGILNTTESLYALNSKPLLYALSQNALYKNKIILTDNNPGFDFYQARLTPAKKQKPLQEIAEILRSLMAQNQLQKQLELTKEAEKIWATLHVSKTKFFLDLVNVNIDLKSDSISPSKSFGVSILLPQEFEKSGLKIKFYDADKTQEKILTFKRSGGRIIFDVPGFRVYSAVILEKN